MSHAPFDGVLLDDTRPHPGGPRPCCCTCGWPGPGASLEAHGGRPGPRPAGSSWPRAAADTPCAASGSTGWTWATPGAPHSLAGLADHLEAYLQEVDRAGYLEPDEALWQAVDLELAGQAGALDLSARRAMAHRAGLRDLVPARLRALACVPGLGGAIFGLATRKGGDRSGLFGSPQPLAEWLLDGLEQHGQGLPNDWILLEEPPGWGAVHPGSAPWSTYSQAPSRTFRASAAVPAGLGGRARGPAPPRHGAGLRLAG